MIFKKTEETKKEIRGKNKETEKHQTEVGRGETATSWNQHNSKHRDSKIVETTTNPETTKKRTKNKPETAKKGTYNKPRNSKIRKSANPHDGNNPRNS